jgi:integrase
VAYTRVDEIPEADAQKKMEEWLRLGGDVESAGKVQPIRLSALSAKFCVWLGKNRSERTVGERRAHLRRFLAVHGDGWIHTLKLKHLENFLAGIDDPLYRRHHAVSIKAMIRWGRNHSHLPANFDPYSGLSMPATGQKHLLESALPTEQEIAALLEHADPDLRDLIQFWRGTGCRTGEALKITPADFSPRARTVTLRDHKTSGKTGRLRVIVLDDAAFEVVQRRVIGVAIDQPIFTTQHGGRGWKMNNLSHHWIELRAKAGVRETVTPYSFRHLWASDAIESGVDLSKVAKMMGSSTAVVERYYAHFRTDSLQDAHRLVAELRAKRDIGAAKSPEIHPGLEEGHEV